MDSVSKSRIYGSVQTQIPSVSFPILSNTLPPILFSRNYAKIWEKNKCYLLQVDKDSDIEFQRDKIAKFWRQNTMMSEF